MSKKHSPDNSGPENRGSFSCNSACSVLFPPQWHNGSELCSSVSWSYCPTCFSSFCCILPVTEAASENWLKAVLHSSGAEKFFPRWTLRIVGPFLLLQRGYTWNRDQSPFVFLEVTYFTD